MQDICSVPVRRQTTRVPRQNSMYTRVSMGFRYAEGAIGAIPLKQSGGLYSLGGPASCGLHFYINGQLQAKARCVACRKGRIGAFGRLISCAGSRNIPQNVEFLMDYLAEIGCRAGKYGDLSFDGINP